MEFASILTAAGQEPSECSVLFETLKQHGFTAISREFVSFFFVKNGFELANGEPDLLGVEGMENCSVLEYPRVQGSTFLWGSR